MKIRNGFVSNSSTSSFCLFGACIENEKARDVLRQIDPECDEFDCAEVIAEALKLDYSSGPPESYYIYLGRDPASLTDSETGAQFKQSVKDALSKYFPDAELSWHCEGWYDG